MSDTFHFIKLHDSSLMIDNTYFWNPKLEMLYPETIKKQISQISIF